MTASSSLVGRVLMTTDPIGGVWNFSMDLCRGLAEHGIDVVLASMGGSLHADQRVEVAALRNVEFVESTFRLEWMENPWDDVSKAGTWLEWLEAEFSPDVVHLNGYVHAALPWSAPVVVAGHSDVLSWRRAVRGEEAPPDWAEYADIVRVGLQAAAFVTAPSRAMLHALERQYGPLPPRRVIYNGRDPRSFYAEKKEPYIFSVGRLWDEAKNARMLASVAEGLSWSVRLAGDAAGPDGATVDFPQVEILGRCSQQRLVGLYSRAAIFALPARYEPFGLSALEAGLSGCALVLGDIPSLHEIWEDAAIYVEPNDSRELRAVLSVLIENPDRRNEMGARAQIRAREYSRDRMVREYLAVYSDLATAEAVRRSVRFPA